MPETYGLPEPEPTRIEAVQRVVNEVVAGQGVVRRTLLYALIGIALVSGGILGVLAGGMGILALLFLMASDQNLA
ncbi:MAG: hypothetical protein H0W36_05215 [Gemmatimonadetes bacterium]|nr:hypothetical protein [Gemmatimonadota bacterium]